jgi:hypothetical protein
MRLPVSSVGVDGGGGVLEGGHCAQVASMGRGSKAEVLRG